jgi:hypothetical protein
VLKGGGGRKEDGRTKGWQECQGLKKGRNVKICLKEGMWRKKGRNVQEGKKGEKARRNVKEGRKKQNKGRTVKGGRNMRK